MTDQEGGKAMLEALERGNLFVVPLDDKRRWYRYHQLFADDLQARLLEEHPDQVPVLHGRASEWYERNGQPADAIHHALAAADFERVAGLVERVARATIRRSNQSASLLEWLKVVPDDLVRARPVLSTYYAFALLGMGEMDAEAARLTDAERWLDAPLSKPPSGAGDTSDRPGEAAPVMDWSQAAVAAAAKGRGIYRIPVEALVLQTDPTILPEVPRASGGRPRARGHAAGRARTRPGA